MRDGGSLRVEGGEDGAVEGFKLGLVEVGDECRPGGGGGEGVRREEEERGVEGVAFGGGGGGGEEGLEFNGGTFVGVCVRDVVEEE